MHGRIIEFDKAVRNQMAMQKWPCKETYASLIIPSSKSYDRPISPPLALVPIPPHPHLVPERSQTGERELEAGMIPVTNGIEGPVRSLTQSVDSNTAAIGRDVEVRIESQNVPSAEIINEEIARGQRFRRHHVWSPSMSACSRTALWTETADPMPRPPSVEFDNLEALKTIKSRPDLFKVSTPIRIDVFKSLLAHHPNPALTQFAPDSAKAEEDFLRSQIDKEVEVGRYSQPFGSDLLPGMYSMPIHAVPKPNSDKHRLVTDHSAGKFALNSMILHEDIAGVTFDNVQDLGNGLRVHRRSNPDTPLVIWKADVSEAYRQMPMRPLWQIKQVVSFQGRRYIDRRNVFGGRASQRIFHAFMSLVTWIAIFNLLLFFLYIYVDDSFSFQEASAMELHSPYKKMLPQNLVRLLRLWDAIGLPHEERKQIFGPELPVIGFDVDPNIMRVRMSDESRLILIQSLVDFAQRGTRRSLRDFQRLAGHLNWALNVYPFLRPGLSALYAKTAGKQESWAVLWVNRDVTRELAWIVRHLQASNGVYFLKSVSWSYRNLPESVLRVYTDASMGGVAYWFPSLNLGFQSTLPSYAGSCDIFFFEALAVTSAILDAVTRLPPDGRLAVFTDSLDTVALFNSLATLPSFNWMLMTAMDAIIASGINFRGFHIPGVQNVVADHLSRWQNAEAIHSSPDLRIHSFTPPRPTLGAAKL
ncbi:DNA/RNA polymerase [Suillus brevipes Sb2]|nr:DNA/RNA polymerase [Suillus brevipes Sb2]